MDPTAFETALRQDGYAELTTRSLPANDATSPHSHPFSVRALVSAGEITLTADGTATSYKPGDVFTMAQGCQHTEQVGPTGVTYLVGRRTA